jgi:hypothetical protein
VLVAEVVVGRCRSVMCAWCGGVFAAVRLDAQYSSAACRMAAHRARR